jgi:hypothetical protein
MFQWFEKILIKVAKKILNKHAPKGEFIAYINKREEKLLKQYGGAGLKTKKTGIKSFFGGLGGFFSAFNFFSNLNPVVKIIATIAIAWIFRPKVPDLPDFGVNEADDFETGVLLNKQSNDANIPVIYGERLVGGVRVFVETSGKDNKYLYMAIILSEGEINSIEEIIVDDNVVTFDGSLSDNVQRDVASSDANYYIETEPAIPPEPEFPEVPAVFESLIRIEPHFGKDNQSSSSLLRTLSSWGSSHRLRGLSYLAIRFQWNQDAFSGIPKVQARIKGKKVVAYNSSLVAQTPAYSTNPAWCLLDYLTNERYGKGLSINEINLQSFYDASQVCETQVTPYSGSGNINIFDTNAVLDTSKKLLENVRELLKGCRGYLPYTQGKYSLVIETTGTASITLTEDDIIGGYTLQTPAKNEKYNRVIVSYVNPDRNYQVDEVQFPPLDESGLANADKHATMKNDDGGFLLEGRFDFGKVITNTYQAEEMAEVILRRTRDSIRLSINVSFSAYDLAIGDIVNITHSSIGFNAKPFRVLSIKFNPDFTLGLDLVEHQNAHFTWATKRQAPLVPATNLPNPFSVQKPSIDSVTDELVELFDGSVVSKLIINLSNTDSFADEFEVQYKESTTANFRLLRRGSNKTIEKYPVKEGVIYNIRARTINSLGVKSAFTSTRHEVISAFDPPDNVQNYSIDVVGDKLHHTFDAVTNLDLDYYEIRFTSDTTETVYANTTVLVPRIARPATSVVTPFVGTGKYFIKAVDKFGVRSATADSVVIEDQVFEGFKAVQTITEEPTFDGTKTDCVVVDNTLILDTSNLFDDTSGNFDDATGLFDAGFGSVNTSGSYEFNTGFDFSNKFKFKILLNNFDVTHLSYVDSFDAQQGLFDDKQGLFDGGTNQSVSTNVQLQIALSDDNVTFGSFANFKSGDFVARAVKFKALLTTSDTSATPQINNLSLKFILPKYVQDGSNIASGTNTAGKTVTFTNAFYQVPTITIIGQDLNTGDYFQLNSKDRSSFNVEFFDSGGNTVDRTFDFQAVGIGSQQ